MIKTYSLILLFTLSLLSACSTRIDSFPDASPTQPALPKFNTSLFQSLAEPIEIEKITALNPAQQGDFFRYFNNPKRQNITPNLRAYNYLSLVIDQLRYSDETLTAEQTLTQQTGNCLSLTNLTKAISQLANVDISFDLMENNLGYNFQGDFLTRIDHIRAVLKGKTRPIDSASPGLQLSSTTNLRVDYFPSGRLHYIAGMSGALQTSLYYSNLAVDFLINKDYPSAFSYAQKALKVSSDNSSALNTMGILHRRLGDLTSAEQIYLYGIRFLRNKLTFQKNYTALLESQKRFDEVQELQEKIHAFENLGPWYWIRSGQQEHHNSNYSNAIKYYDRALTISPQLDRVHLYIAKAYSALGRTKQSKEHLNHAIEYAETSTLRKKYKTKLDALKER